MNPCPYCQSDDTTTYTKIKKYISPLTGKKRIEEINDIRCGNCGNLLYGTSKPYKGVLI